MTDYIQSCLPRGDNEEIVAQIDRLTEAQEQELDRWLRDFEEDGRKMDLVGVTIEEAGFSARIQYGLYFPNR